MGWPFEGAVQSLSASVLKRGPVPRHVAFIMDGNRRWARRRNQETLIGHSSGFEKLKESLDWCLELGVQVLTIYAFSIENFKRTKEEVDYLMDLAKEKFAEMLRKEDIIEKHGVSVRVLGDLSLLPTDVQQIMAKVIYNSRHNSRAILNVCFSYTSRQEMFNSMRELAQAVSISNDSTLSTPLLLESDITEDLFERCLYTGGDAPELLIRTSGEHRFSDFLLWQCSQSCTVFLSVLWPDFSAWHFYYSILLYQKDYPKMMQKRTTYLAERDRIQYEDDQLTAVHRILESEEEEPINSEPIEETLQRLLNDPSMRNKIQQVIKDIVAEREARIQAFLQYREALHLKELQRLVGIKEVPTPK